MRVSVINAAAGSPRFRLGIKRSELKHATGKIDAGTTTRCTLRGTGPKTPQTFELTCGRHGTHKLGAHKNVGAGDDPTCCSVSFPAATWGAAHLLNTAFLVPVTFISQKMIFTIPSAEELPNIHLRRGKRGKASAIPFGPGVTPWKTKEQTSTPTLPDEEATETITPPTNIGGTGDSIAALKTAVSALNEALMHIEGPISFDVFGYDNNVGEESLFSSVNNAEKPFLRNFRLTTGF